MPSIVVSAIIFGILAVSAVLLKDYMSGGTFEGKERMDGKTVIVTGANTGIGKETVRELSRRGAKVIMACRDEGKCEQALNEIVKEKIDGSVICKKLDLSSFASIRAFAKTINKEEPRLDVLINNAGVMWCPRTLTEDGLELQLGVNHFGHFLLTQLLLEKLKASSPSRIVIVSSLAHIRGEINFDDLNSEKSYGRLRAYGQSKLANVLHANELSRRLEGTGVTANSLHPGGVDTELPRYVPVIGNPIVNLLISPFKFLLMKTPVQGAQTTLRLAIDPALEKVSGKYFSDCKEKDTNPLAQDKEIAKKLWAISEQLTKSKLE